MHTLVLSVACAWWVVLSIHDIVGNADRKVAVAVKVPVLLSDEVLHSGNEGVQRAKTVLARVLGTGRDASQWDNAVIQNPAHVGSLRRILGGLRALQHLSDHVSSEWCDVLGEIRL